MIWFYWKQHTEVDLFKCLLLSALSFRQDNSTSWTKDLFRSYQVAFTSGKNWVNITVDTWPKLRNQNLHGIPVWNFEVRSPVMGSLRDNSDQWLHHGQNVFGFSLLRSQPANQAVVFVFELCKLLYQAFNKFPPVFKRLFLSLATKRLLTNIQIMSESINVARCLPHSMMAQWRQTASTEQGNVSILNVLVTLVFRLKSRTRDLIGIKMLVKKIA